MCENAAALATASQIGLGGWRAALAGGRATRLFRSPPCPPRSKTQGCSKLKKMSSLSFSSSNFFLLDFHQFKYWISHVCIFSDASLFSVCVALSGKPRSAAADPGPGQRSTSSPLLVVTSYQAAPKISILIW